MMVLSRSKNAALRRRPVSWVTAASLAGGDRAGPEQVVPRAGDGPCLLAPRGPGAVARRRTRTLVRWVTRWGVVRPDDGR